MKRVMFAVALMVALLPISASALIKVEFPLEKSSSGESVVLLQQRLMDLGYIQFRATGRYGDMTYLGVIDFQTNAGISPDGIVGKDTYEKIFLPEAKRAPINDSIVRTVGPAPQKTPKEYGMLVDWHESTSKDFSVGKTIKIIDFNTLREFYVTRTGGTNHADVQTSDEESHKTFLKCFGGEYTWEKRSVLAEIDGELYAASMFGMPNNNDKLNNGFMKGSVCLYFYGSKSDVGGAIDVEHDEMVNRAANA